MPIVISIPDDCKALADAMTELMTSVTRARRRVDGGRAVDYAQVERELGDRTAAVERAAHHGILKTLDIDAPAVVIDGRVHTRVHRAEGRYYTLAGDVVVERALYRAERNGPVVDAITLRTGALAGGWMPETATAMAHLLQQGTSREGEATGQRLGRVAYSHSSFERVGQAVGQQYAERKTAIDDALIVALDVPAAAQSVSFGIDRVSLPLEEPRPRPVGRPRKDAPRRPVQRVFRMASCTTVTFHDETGEALHTIRQGAIPSVEPVDLCDDPGYARLRTPRLLARAGKARLGGAAGVRRGAGPAVLAQWRLDLLNRPAAVDDILTVLTASGKCQVRVGTARPVHEAITYLENHRDLLDYPGARRRGLPIGSGNTEATCKTLFTVRMKRSGARWKEATAAHVINLRALALGDRWEPALQLTLAPLRKAVRQAA